MTPDEMMLEAIAEHNKIAEEQGKKKFYYTEDEVYRLCKGAYLLLGDHPESLKDWFEKVKKK